MLSGDPSPQSLGQGLSALVNSRLQEKGAMLVRGLDQVIRSNKEFSQMVELMGEKFAYTAGLATRKEFDDAPGLCDTKQWKEESWILTGVVAAADDPPETTIEPHLEMSYNRKMPGDNDINVEGRR